MQRTLAAHSAVWKKMLFLVSLSLALTLPAAVAPAAGYAAGAKARTACANKLCTAYRSGAVSCRANRGHKAVARCFIDRAARHFGQSQAMARRVAWRESRYKWWVTAPAGYRGLYQFGNTLWQSTPYRKQSPYNPRYASLAAMWVWSKGGYSHWPTYF